MIALATTLGNLSFTTPEEAAKFFSIMDPNNTPKMVPETVDTPAINSEVKEDKYIKFGRDGVSYISFYESELEGDEKAIFFAKCMKILMVEYKKTILESLRILSIHIGYELAMISHKNSNLSERRIRGLQWNYINFSRNRYSGWGAYIRGHVNSSEFIGSTEKEMKEFLEKEMKRSSSNLSNFETLIEKTIL